MMKGIKNAVKAVHTHFGEMSILVNNAGVFHSQDLAKQDFKDIEIEVRTNLEGLIKMTRACLPYLTDMIINIASGAGMQGYAGMSTYCGTKWGIRGFTKALAEELNIPVYVVNPGTTATRMTNFSGTPAEKVAQIVVNTAKGVYDLPSGSDINVWDYVSE